MKCFLVWLRNFDLLPNCQFIFASLKYKATIVIYLAIIMQSFFDSWEQQHYKQGKYKSKAVYLDQCTSCVLWRKWFLLLLPIAQLTQHVSSHVWLPFLPFSCTKEAQLYQTKHLSYFCIIDRILLFPFCLSSYQAYFFSYISLHSQLCICMHISSSLKRLLMLSYDTCRIHLLFMVLLFSCYLSYAFLFPPISGMETP